MNLENVFSVCKLFFALSFEDYASHHFLYSLFVSQIMDKVKS